MRISDGSSGVCSADLRLPEEAVHAIEDEDDWRRAMVLQASCSEDELLDDSLGFHDLLYRLFHEEGVRVFEPRPLTDACSRPRAKLENVMEELGRATGGARGGKYGSNWGGGGTF